VPSATRRIGALGSPSSGSCWRLYLGHHGLPPLLALALLLPPPLAPASGEKQRISALSITTSAPTAICWLYPARLYYGQVRAATSQPRGTSTQRCQSTIDLRPTQGLRSLPGHTGARGKHKA